MKSPAPGRGGALVQGLVEELGRSYDVIILNAVLDALQMDKSVCFTSSARAVENIGVLAHSASYVQHYGTKLSKSRSDESSHINLGSYRDKVNIRSRSTASKGQAIFRRREVGYHGRDSDLAISSFSSRCLTSDKGVVSSTTGQSINKRSVKGSNSGNNLGQRQRRRSGCRLWSQRR